MCTFVVIINITHSFTQSNNLDFNLVFFFHLNGSSFEKKGQAAGSQRSL